MTEQQIEGLRQWYDVMKNNCELVELRLMDGKKIYSGYFTDIDTIVRELAKYPQCNCYYTLNGIDKALYSRKQKDHFEMNAVTTADKDIVSLDWILIDCDCEKPTGVMSTDEELEYAKKKANAIYAYLRNENFERPIVGVSGSGVHMLYRIQMKNTEERHKLIKSFLDALGLMFSDERVKIDSTVGNPARISRLFYTVNMKGSNTQERPWRMAHFVSVPDEIKPTSYVYIERVAKIAEPEIEKPSRENHYRSSDSFNLEEFLVKYNIEYTKKVETNDYIKYVLKECVFNPEHKAPDAAVFDFKGKGFQYVCLHNSDRHFTFKDFRLKFDPDAYSKDTYAEFVHKSNYYGMKREFVPESVTKEKGNPWKKMSEIRKTELSADDYIATGIPTIDNLIIGAKRGHVTVLTGRRGCAKSTLMNEIILNAAQRGYKIGYWSGEMSESELKTWLTLQAAGKQFNLQSKFNNYYYTPNTISEKIDPWLDEYLRIYSDNYSQIYLDIEERIKELIQQWGLDIAVFDNLMSMSIEELGARDEWQNQKILLQKLTQLAKRYNIHVYLVAHPNKQREWLDVESISGSGDISNYAQNVWLVSRIYKDKFEQQAKNTYPQATIQDILNSEATNILEIGKCRDKGAAVGKIVKFWFEMESNRLKSDPYEVINYNWQVSEKQMTMQGIASSYEVSEGSSAFCITPDMPFAPPQPEVENNCPF
jgi:hypothetical protein